jgi:hypothetical protein
LKYIKKYLFPLLLLEIVAIIAGYLVSQNCGCNLIFGEIVLLSFLFLLNTLVALFIFFRGQDRGPESQTMHSLVALTLKFLIELAIAFVWFIIAKKTGITSVLSFFVLYLTFTLFSVLLILKTLKYKSL